MSTPSIVDLVTSQLGPQGIQALGQQLGLDPATTQKAVSAAIPLLTGGLAKNAATPQGAASLHQAVSRDHDGSILDNLGGLLSGGGGDMGGAILGHIFGNRQGGAADGLARTAGIDAGTAGQLLMMLAPVILGALGKMTRTQGLDTGGLTDVLNNSHAQAQAQAPSGLGAVLGSLLDQDKDGSMVDDLARMGGGLLGGLFGKK
ncbi:MAG TPA: hypothetical protein DD490_06795 [Acidobacteria bacterium]|nr:hypothetical protein [Acidobacteriota bacterium]